MDTADLFKTLGGISGLKTMIHVTGIVEHGDKLSFNFGSSLRASSSNHVEITIAGRHCDMVFSKTVGHDGKEVSREGGVSLSTLVATFEKHTGLRLWKTRLAK